MLKARLINRSNGISKSSGKAWCKISLASDKADGARIIQEFWCNPQLAAKVATIPVDSYVYVTAELDDSLHFNIADLRVVDSTKQ